MSSLSNNNQNNNGAVTLIPFNPPVLNGIQDYGPNPDISITGFD